MEGLGNTTGIGRNRVLPIGWMMNRVQDPTLLLPYEDCVSPRYIYIEIGTRKSRRCQPLSKVKHHPQLFSSSGRPTARALGRSDHETDSFFGLRIGRINKNYVEACGNIIRAIGIHRP